MVIINDILDLSKIEAGRMELEKVNFNLKDIMSLVEDTLQYKAFEKNIKFIIKQEELPLNIVGDPVRLSQILVNITSNAIKFTDKGSVTLSYEIKEQNDHEIKIIFRIKDTGIGMTETEVNKIFDSFSQANSSTTRKYGGTGLGLTITKQLVNLFMGTIDVKSKPGAGSEFLIEIPFQKNPTNETENKKFQTSEFPTNDVGAVRILLVEDNDFNQIVGQDTIKYMFPDAVVDVAENGQIALDKIMLNHYDIVLMDIQMPEMDGYTATRKIREQRENHYLPVIAMTANAIKEEVDKCFECGMDDYIAKPFEPDQFYEKITKALYKKSMMNTKL